MSVRYQKSKRPNRSHSIVYDSLRTQEFQSLGFLGIPSKYSRNFQILTEILDEFTSLKCIDIKIDNGIPDCSQNSTISTQDIAEILSVMVPNQLPKSNNRRCEKVWHIT